MQYLFKQGLLILALTFGFISCRNDKADTEKSEVQQLMDDPDAEVKVKENKIKIKTDEKEIKIKKEDGEYKKKVETDNYESKTKIDGSEVKIKTDN